MSIWSELLFLHGHLTRPPRVESTEPEGTRPGTQYDPDRLRALLGCRSVANHDTEMRGPLLGVRGLA